MKHATQYLNDYPRECGQASAARSADSGQLAGMAIALLTGGGDPHYAFGLTTSLLDCGVSLDLIGSDEFELPEFQDRPNLRLLNLRGSVCEDVSIASKTFRILAYYAKLILYAAKAKPKLFHILWNSRFQTFDRTLLMLYYRSLGKKVVLTAHNVNAGRRDGTDGLLNRLTLRMQYGLCHCIFVHTELMKRELIDEFGVRESRVTIIPFGINNAVPQTTLTSSDAKRQLGLGSSERVILFFGRITPYKGLEYLISAFRQIKEKSGGYRLIIAGKPDKCEDYWKTIRENIRAEVERGEILLKDRFIPDEETETYMKAADALVLPYRHIYQSGILFLAQSFGLPVLASDVGSFKDEIVQDKTGFIFRPEDSSDLSNTIQKYFASDIYAQLDAYREEICAYAAAQHSWKKVSEITMSVYAGLVKLPSVAEDLSSNLSGTTLNVKID